MTEVEDFLRLVKIQRAIEVINQSIYFVVRRQKVSKKEIKKSLHHPKRERLL